MQNYSFQPDLDYFCIYSKIHRYSEEKTLF